MTTRISLVKMAHECIGETLGKGGIAIDATVGNGNDTLFLLRQVMPSGLVFGFDIQQAALDSAKLKLGRFNAGNGLMLYRSSHADMAEKIPLPLHGKINACMFNLGYLPGGDKSIISRAESTLPALTAATRILSEGGIITLVAYPGHPGGDRETELVHGWCARLDRDRYKVSTIFSAAQTESAPRLFVIRKTGAGPFQ